MLKRLPIGIQTFSEIIEGNYLYIDKTEIAYNLINSYKYVFLSRPRRFGKSLFLDTLQNIFEGNKELFKGLNIYNRWNFKERYPVIKISFSGARSSKELLASLKSILEKNQEILEVSCNSDDYAICFNELIEKTYKKYNQKVVILIDEYDKAILDSIKKIDEAIENREILKRFYSQIKDNDKYIKFVFLTGVSKFSKTSIFSGLNNITDITLDPRYGNICGYTQNDIETSFLPYLDGVDLKKLKLWYNGYNFLGDRVYNPYDILLFIDKGKKYRNYWFETGTPTFLVDLIKEKNYFLPKLSNLVVGETLLGSFDIENIQVEVLLFQAGYLTIKEEIIDEFDFIEYKLSIPNKEVKRSLNSLFVTFLTNNNDIQTQQKRILRALISSDLKSFKSSLETIFANIPYNNYVKNNIASYEGYYTSVIYTYLASLGLTLIAEDVTNKGRIDLTIKIDNCIYIIEFKVGSSDALGQIKEKNYAQKYLKENKTIFLVGINFDEDEKNISNFEWEKVKKTFQSTK